MQQINYVKRTERGSRFTADGRCKLATLIMPRAMPPCSPEKQPGRNVHDDVSTVCTWQLDVALRTRDVCVYL